MKSLLRRVAVAKTKPPQLSPRNTGVIQTVTRLSLRYKYSTRLPLAWNMDMPTLVLLATLLTTLSTPTSLVSARHMDGEPAIRDLQKLRSLIEASNVPCNLGGPAAWQSVDYCGINCAYLILKSKEIDIKYNELVKAVKEIPKGGLSLLQVKELCEKFGLICTICKDETGGLESIEPPAILHLGEPESPGHFVCYYKKFKGRGFQIVDGTTGIERIQDLYTGELPREFSGYYIIAKEKNFNYKYINICLLLLIVGCLAEALFYWAYHARAKIQKN